MQETWVWSLVWEEPLEMGTATHFSILIFWPGEFHGESDMTERLTLSLSEILLCVNKQNLQSYKISRVPVSILGKASSVKLEKAMATHSSTLAWKIPWTEEPGGLQSMGLLRLRHNWATSLSLFTFMHWRRKWQPTPILLPGESQGWGSVVGCRLWGHTESDTTEAT